MPKGSIPEREKIGIERTMLLFYFVYSVTMTVVTIQSGWPIWLALFTNVGWLVGLILHLAKIQTYMFRAYAITCLMQMSVILWSLNTESLSMTIPVMILHSVALVLYGIPEVIYIPTVVSIFLIGYHLLIENTVSLSSGEQTLQTVLEIISLFFTQYIVAFLIKKRLEGIEKQGQIIASLIEAERSKDDFMANVSHEIRTPINTICGISEIVLREEISNQVRADVYDIQTAGRHLQSIVSDVLDFTEMQSGKMSLMEETYSIASTMNDVINMSMAYKNDKQVELVVDCDANLPIGLIGDEQKIRRVIMNLVNNALKFTAEGCVCIIVGFRKTEYGINLIVRIKDTGIGMKKESMEKLFTNFNQVDTKRNRQEEGIGLGLAISQALVDMMGGFITVSSEFGRGSEFQFVIPQKIADPTPIAMVEDRERINAALYINMDRYSHPGVRDAYSQVIYHMIEQLNVKCHVCQNLLELKRRVDRETFTHVFVGIDEYEEDKEFFDRISQTSKVIALLERTNDLRISNPRIRHLYLPLFILPITMVLNDEKMIQGIDVNYYFQGKFTAPESYVLVVDDNLMNIRVMEGMLQPYEIKVDTATSGAEALEKIDSMRYDVIFMDHMMPEMDGIETLQRIRQKQGNYFKKIPVVVVTANAVGGMREVFLKEGFQDFVAKPIEASVLERVLGRVLPQEKLVPVHDNGKNESDFSAVEGVKPQETRKVEGKQENVGHPATVKKQETIQRQESAQGQAPAAYTENKATDDKQGPVQNQGSATRQTDLPPDSFDEQTGLRYCGRLEDYMEILRLTEEAGPEDQKKIRAYYEKKDWKNYTTLVHALKSTMLSIGVEKLSGMAKELELAGKRGDEEYILEHHDATMVEYTRILNLLQESKSVHPQGKDET